MTRETKIGLLVGLAFIIVIGILLSDHLTSSTEPPGAPMSQAGPTARSAVNTPVRAQESPVVQIAAPQVTPNQPVPTADDLSPRPQPVKYVQLNPPAQDQPLTITNPPAGDAVTAMQDQPAGNTQPVRADTFARSEPLAQNPPATPPVGTQPVTPRGNDPIVAQLNREAARLGEQIVPAGGEPAPGAVRKYKAEPGDTLSHIATKAYGTASKAARDAIINANPSLKDNPNLVIEGRSYVIPDLAAARPAVSATEQKPQPAAPAATNVYVVEEGDNLTRIATEHCGTPTAVAAIKELNRDQLNGSDVIRPGMKLKLPARVAVGN